jgi:pantoate kinase
MTHSIPNSPLDPLVLAGAKAKGKRPFFLKDPDVERVMAVTMAVAQELAVMRERLDTVERLLSDKGVTQDDIENFTPSKAEAEQRGAWTQEYLARIFRIYQQDIEALSVPNEPTSEEVGHELAKG